MTITYPLDMPTDVIGISQIELRARNAVGVSQSPFTFQQQIFRHSGQMWSASIQIAPVNREFGEPWIAFLLSLNGPVGTFLLGDPLGACSRGAAADGSPWFLADGVWRDDGVWLDSLSWAEDGADLVFMNPTVDGLQATDTQTVTVQGLAFSTEDILRAGDYVQFGTGSTTTLHKVLLDVTSDALGKATLTLWPRPRRALADDEAIVYENAKGRFRLSTSEQSWEIANNLRYGVAFDAMEAF